MNEITLKIGRMPKHNYDAIQKGVLVALTRWLPEISKAKNDGLTREQFERQDFF